MHIYDISEYAHILCTDKYIIFTELVMCKVDCITFNCINFKRAVKII